MKYTILLLFLFIPLIDFSQLLKLPPKDESKEDPELHEFIKKLREATLVQDTNFIVQNLAEQVYTTAEGGEQTDKDGFVSYYFEGESYSGFNELWYSLSAVFAIGGGGFSANREEYFMPYTSANLYTGEPFESLGSFVVALSSKVKVYSAPNSFSSIIKTLDYEIVPIDFESETDTEFWIPILTNTGKRGYVQHSDVVYTIANRCGLVKEDGAWKLKFSGGFD